MPNSPNVLSLIRAFCLSVSRLHRLVLAHAAIICLALSLFLGSGYSASAQQSTAEGGISTPQENVPGAEQFSVEERAALDAIIREYLLENPEVILEAVQRLEARQRAEERNRQRKALATMKDKIIDGSNAPVLGNPEGDVTLVEFFDYNCPYCKRMTDTLQTLIKQDDGLRIVMREFPILSEQSRFAARAALASRNQGKYEEFHFALMNAKGRADEKLTMAMAKKTGLDLEQLRADMDAAEVQEHLEESNALAQAIGIRGTPAFVVGNELIPGATSLSQLQALIAASRDGS